MKRNLRFLALACLPLAGFGLGWLGGIDLDPVQAGGVCPTAARGTYITSNQDGATVYEWNLASGDSSVTRYNFDTGVALRRNLRSPRSSGKEGGARPVVPVEQPEIVISGVIWTPDPLNRVAIINGETVREGEIFTTRTGKKYKVTEIKRSKDVEYHEVK
ncbi:MAG: hypothetical protein ACYTFG_15375 [Planctomycetota bacterium]|jgi:hypothetical protein